VSAVANSLLFRLMDVFINALVFRKAGFVNLYGDLF
jgi:hypothetical protein